MKNAIIIIAIAAAAYLLFRPRTTANGEKKETLFSSLKSGIYTGSLLTATASPTGESTPTSDGSTTTTTSTTTSSSGRRTTGVAFSLNNQSLTPFL